jgi:hypothetical protein
MIVALFLAHRVGDYVLQWDKLRIGRAARCRAFSRTA